MHNKLTVINIYHNIHLLGSPATLTSSRATINQGKYSAGAASSCHCISGNSHPRGGKWHKRDSRNCGRLHISNCYTPIPLMRYMWHSGLKMTSGCREIGGVASNVYGPLKGFWFYLAESISISGRNYLYLKEREMNHLHYQTHGKIILSSTHRAFFLWVFFLGMNYPYWQVAIFSEQWSCYAVQRTTFSCKNCKCPFQNSSSFQKRDLHNYYHHDLWHLLQKMAQQPHSLTLDEGKKILTSQLLYNLPTIVSPSTSASW